MIMIIHMYQLIYKEKLDQLHQQLGKHPIPIPKSSTMLKTNIESSVPIPELPPSKFLFFFIFQQTIFFFNQAPPIISFQPAIRARIPFNLIINKYHR